MGLYYYCLYIFLVSYKFLCNGYIYSTVIILSFLFQSLYKNFFDSDNIVAIGISKEKGLCKTIVLIYLEIIYFVHVLLPCFSDIYPLVVSLFLFDNPARIIRLAAVLTLVAA